MSERGQASIETVFVVVLVLVVAFAGWDLLRVAQACGEAHRLADQAAVLTLEQKPLPGWLAKSVDVDHGRVTATVRVCAVTSGVGCFEVHAVGRIR